MPDIHTSGVFPTDLLPTELVDMILSYLHGDLATLRHCRLVCKGWAEIARPHLFHYIQVGPDELEFDSPELSLLALRAITRRPQIANCVKSLQTDGYATDGRYDHLLHWDTLLWVLFDAPLGFFTFRIQWPLGRYRLNFSSLRTLSIHGHALTADHLAYVLLTIPRLERLHVSYCTILSADGDPELKSVVELLSNNEGVSNSLKTLGIRSLKIQSAHRAELARLMRVFTVLIDMGCTLPRLETLCMDSQLNDAGLELFAGLLQYVRESLKTLTISCNISLIGKTEETAGSLFPMPGLSLRTLVLCPGASGSLVAPSFIARASPSSVQCAIIRFGLERSTKVCLRAYSTYWETLDEAVRSNPNLRCLVFTLRNQTPRWLKQRIMHEVESYQWNKIFHIYFDKDFHEHLTECPYLEALEEWQEEVPDEMLPLASGKRGLRDEGAEMENEDEYALGT